MTSIADNLDKIAQRIQEHDAGYSYEYEDQTTGERKIFNTLDYKAGLIIEMLK